MAASKPLLVSRASGHGARCTFLEDNLGAYDDHVGRILFAVAVETLVAVDPSQTLVSGWDGYDRVPHCNESTVRSFVNSGPNRCQYITRTQPTGFHKHGVLHIKAYTTSKV